MSYLVVETHGGAKYSSIVTDENGKNKVFNDETEAADCQDGLIIAL